MKVNRLILLLSFIQLSSFAQRFGVDIGYAYTINQLKIIPVDYPLQSTETELKQYIFPNICIRPYIKILGNFSLYTGIDLVKYKFSQYYHFGDPHKQDYRIQWIVSEIHAPLMIRWKVKNTSKQYRLSLYAGMFARIPGKRINENYSEYGGMESNLYLKEKWQRYTNMVVGIHQCFSVGNCAEAYIDAQLKYLPGYYYGTPNLEAIFLPFRVENKFTFSLSAGTSLFKPDKKQFPVSDPSRLED